MPRLKRTRLKLVVSTVVLFFFEAFATHFFEKIPIGELFVAQGGLVISYVTSETMKKKYENNVPSKLPLR